MKTLIASLLLSLALVGPTLAHGEDQPGEGNTQKPSSINFIAKD